MNEIDPSSLFDQLQSGMDIVLLDIRSAVEMTRGVIPESRPMPMHLIPLRMQELPKDTDIVLYCHTGARSFHACNFLLQQGFSNVLNLRGGIVAWAQQGLETVAPGHHQEMARPAGALPTGAVSPI